MARERETTLLTDKAVQFATAETYVFSDSVLCLGGISTEPVFKLGKLDQVVCGVTLFYRIGSDRLGTDGIGVGNFQGFTTWGILDEIQKMMAEFMCEPEHFQGRIIFMPMYNDIEW